jgi:hypothetical protein
MTHLFVGGAATLGLVLLCANEAPMGAGWLIVWAGLTCLSWLCAGGNSSFTE